MVLLNVLTLMKFIALLERLPPLGWHVVLILKKLFLSSIGHSEIPELAWILNCSCAKGLMNRAHAYKAAVDMNLSKEDTDPDYGISMGLFGYPVLMAADILMFNATHVPVGKDQIQHIEMARDIAGSFNFKYKPLFVEPFAVVDENTPLLTGLDGRKMSKSYGNTIPLFGDGNPQINPEKALKEAVMQIVAILNHPKSQKTLSIAPFLKSTKPLVRLKRLKHWQHIIVVVLAGVKLKRFYLIKSIMKLPLIVSVIYI